MAVTMKPELSIKAVEHALDLLEVLGEAADDLGVTQLSGLLGVNKSKVFRLLATFERRGYIERDETAGRYRRGPLAYVTGSKLIRHNDLLHHARPLMHDLAQRCTEAACLAVADGDDLVLVDASEPVLPVRVSQLVGRRFSREKVLFWPPEGAEGLCSEADIVVDRGGIIDGVFSLFAPVFGVRGRLLGGLCLMVPDFRASGERVSRDLVPQLRRAGRQLTMKLGCLVDTSRGCPV